MTTLKTDVPGLASSLIEAAPGTARTPEDVDPTAALVGGRPETIEDARADSHADEKASLLTKTVTLIAIVLPFLGLIAAIATLWGPGLNWLYLSMFFVGYVLTGLGITVGFHRYFTHKSFDCGPVVASTLGILGSMAVQGPVSTWAAKHRCHHKHSDHDEDPHSPNTHGSGLKNFFKGLVHAHMGWLLKDDPKQLEKYIPDLNQSVLVRRISATFPLWVLLGLVIPGVIGGVVMQTWTGFWLGVLWGGLARIFFVHHVTWSVNSVCHLWGARPFNSHDHSRNNLLFGILAFGEGWHNNHHAFPASARHGLRWWQFDSSYLVIKSLELVGLVKNVRVPAPERLVSKARTK